MSTWSILLLIGALTYLLRASFLVVRDKPMPTKVERALRYVPVAVLPALVTSVVIGGPNTELSPPRLIAAATAAVIAWKTRSIALTMGGGMGVLWGLQALWG